MAGGEIELLLHETDQHTTGRFPAPAMRVTIFAPFYAGYSCIRFKTRRIAPLGGLHHIYS